MIHSSLKNPVNKPVKTIKSPITAPDTGSQSADGAVPGSATPAAVEDTPPHQPERVAHRHYGAWAHWQACGQHTGKPGLYGKRLGQE